MIPAVILRRVGPPASVGQQLAARPHRPLRLPQCGSAVVAERIVRGDVEPETWRAFELTVIENCSIDEAAVELDKPLGTIYAARSRVMLRLRKAVQELEQAES